VERGPIAPVTAIDQVRIALKQLLRSIDASARRGVFKLEAGETGLNGEARPEIAADGEEE
jgi:hypothetical protein